MKHIVLVAIVAIFISGCSAKKIVDNSKSYERANSASEKSLNGLDRDTK